MLPDEQDRITKYFIDEAKDHLNTIEQGLLNLQSILEEPEMANEVFRAAHSVKGGAAMLGIKSIQAISHSLEDCFRILKEEPVKVDQRLESLFLQVFDTLQELVDQLASQFGLSEELANQKLTEVEPVLQELVSHLHSLVKTPSTQKSTKNEKSSSTKPAQLVAETNLSKRITEYGEESALQLIFRSDVTQALREMLQLFKQTDNTDTREHLQEICDTLNQFGEQFEIPQWVNLMETVKKAIGNQEKTYRTIAVAVFQDIKQAQELVLAGRWTEISESSQLQELVPPEINREPEAEDLNFEDLLEFMPSNEESSTLTFMNESPNQDFLAPDSLDLFGNEIVNYEENKINLDLELANGKEMELLGQPSEKSQVNQRHEHPAVPEVEMDVLNALSSLFGSETEELDHRQTTEESRVETAQQLDLKDGIEFDANHEFADLLFDENSLNQSAVSPELTSDELTSLFDEDFMLESEEQQPNLNLENLTDTQSELLDFGDLSLLDIETEPENSQEEENILWSELESNSEDLNTVIDSAPLNQLFADLAEEEPLFADEVTANNDSFGQLELENQDSANGENNWQGLWTDEPEINANSTDEELVNSWETDDLFGDNSLNEAIESIPDDDDQDFSELLEISGPEKSEKSALSSLDLTEDNQDEIALEIDQIDASENWLEDTQEQESKDLSWLELTEETEDKSELNDLFSWEISDSAQTNPTPEPEADFSFFPETSLESESPSSLELIEFENENSTEISSELAVDDLFAVDLGADESLTDSFFDFDEPQEESDESEPELTLNFADQIDDLFAGQETSELPDNWLTDTPTEMGADLWEFPHQDELVLPEQTAEISLDDLISSELDIDQPVDVSSESLHLTIDSEKELNGAQFAELEALLANQPVDSNIFAELEKLLGVEKSTTSNRETTRAKETVKPKTEQATPVITTTAKPKADQNEWGDMEKLLDERGETKVQGRPRSAQARPNKQFNEQIMKVPVKQLDNMSNLVGELVVNRNSLEQDQERLRQFLDNLLVQVSQLSDVSQRMQDLYERSLLEISLLASRKAPRGPAFRGEKSNSNQEAAGNHGSDWDVLEMDRFTPFHSLSQEIIELMVRVRESAADIEFLVDEADQVTRQLRQVTTQLQEGLTRSRMEPFMQISNMLERGCRKVAGENGKQAELRIEGKDTLIDKMILEKLTDPLTHLMNNAIAHGIEPPEARVAKGKPPIGRITIRAFHQGNQTVIAFSDDGAGIDIERVKVKAMEKRLITPEQAKTMSRLDVYDILFHPGFSTNDEVNSISGRGVGMNVVLDNVNKIRGVINTDSTMGKGTTFTIRLPLTLSISKALCCISDKARIAFPMDGVEDIIKISKERIKVNAENQPCIPWRDQQMPFQPLKELLAYNRYIGRGSIYGGASNDEETIDVIVLRSAGTFLAVQVDQAMGEQEIVIKQLEGPVPKPVGIAGATVMGDGRIVPIADVLELIDLALGRIRREDRRMWEQDHIQMQSEAAEDHKAEPTVLIVDDSITVRELLSMTFNKAGYRVEQARDGQEAWEKLRSGLPCDIVFCDIEMPRMDGLELLSRLQKDPQLSELPIAMLTSRGADKHRQMAIQMGANGYFTKPYLEEALLDAASRMLKGEVLVGSASAT